MKLFNGFSWGILAIQTQQSQVNALNFCSLFNNFIISFLFSFRKKVHYLKFLIMEQNLNWHQVTYEPDDLSLPSKRWGHKTVFVEDQILLFGGFSDVTYLSDLWAYNIHTNKWRQVPTTGTKPQGKSNFTMHFDHVTNQLLIFGGGGPNKRRFNKISLLNWTTKEWTEVNDQPQDDIDSQMPWQRTYHSSEFKYPFLVMFGGEGTGNVDMDDLWVFNIETRKWCEIRTASSKTTIEGKTVTQKIEGRKFHSTAMINNQFFVISGCKMNYTCIPNIYSIDLKQVFINDDGVGLNSIQHSNNLRQLTLEWKQHNIDQNQLVHIQKWGHSSQAYNGKIYIFGGRNQQDCNDLFEFNPSTSILTKLTPTSPNTKLPKSRRRHSSCMIGSSMLIFGGFNQDYFNDLQYISLFSCRDTLNREKYLNEQDQEVIELEMNMFCHFMQEMDKDRVEYDIEVFVEAQKVKEQVMVKSVAAVLAKKSLYFRNCLLYNQSSNPQRNNLTLSLSNLNITPLSFQIFNTFLLKDLLIMPKDFKLKHLWQLLICADYFQVSSLFGLVQRILIVKVIEERENVDDVFNIAANWNMNSLLKVCAEKKVQDNTYFSTYSRVVGISHSASRLKQKHIEQILMQIQFDQIQKGQKRRNKTFRQFGKNIKQYNLVAQQKGLLKPIVNKRKRSIVEKFVESFSKLCSSTEYRKEQNSYEYDEESDSQEMQRKQIKMFVMSFQSHHA